MKIVLVRYRLHLEIFYKDLRLSIKKSTVEDEELLNKYIKRYFELNYRNPVVTAFFVLKILRSR